MAEDQRKTELIASLAQARAQTVSNIRALRLDLDFSTRARRAFKMHPAVWLGAAIGTGLILTRLLFASKPAPVRGSCRRTEATVEKVEKAGLLLGLLKFAFDIARPTLMGWATRAMAAYFQRANHGVERRDMRR